MDYLIQLYKEGSFPSQGVEDEFADDAAALNWAYYYLGLYRCASAEIFEGDRLVTKISSEGIEKRFR